MSLLSVNRIGTTKRKILTNVGWATTGRIVRVLTETLVSIFVARYLGPSQYGLMNYVISFVAIFSIIANFGLDNIEIREIAKPGSDFRVIMGTSFRLRFLFAIVAGIVIVITVFLGSQDAETRCLIFIYALTIVLTSFNVIRNYFTAIVFNRYIVITEIFRCLIGASIKIALLLLKAPLFFFIIALTFDYFLVAGGYLAAYHSKVGKLSEWSFSSYIAKLLIKEAFPLVLSGAAVVIYQRIDQVIIRSLLSDEAVGYFSVAVKFSEFILFVPLVMAQTMAPLLIGDYQTDTESFLRKRQQFVDIIVWVSIALSVVVSLSSYYLIRYTFGVQYLAAVPVLRILAFKAVGMALSNSSGQLIIIEGKQKWAVIRNLIGCLICIMGNYSLIPLFGIIGSAWATLITVAFSGFWGNLIIKPYRNIFEVQVKSLVSGPVRLAKIAISYVKQD
jgi:O-antigen/teichoic acid export membrane protein